MQKMKKLSGGTKLLLAMVAIYIIAGLINSQYASSALQHLWKNIIEIIPILILAFAAVFIINLFVNPERIKRHLGNDSGFRGWVYASLGSILLSGPPYVVFPILGELKKHGMKYSLISVFMNNRNVQPPYIPVMIYYFGLPFTIIVSVYIMIFAILNGMIVGRIMDKPAREMR